MRDEIYCGGLISNGALSHSSGPWKKHKYIRKEGDRYIYSNTKTKSNKLVEGAKKVGEAGLNLLADTIDNAQDVGYSIRRHDELVKMRKERGAAFTNTGHITEEEADELDRRVQKPKSIRETSIFFKKKDGDKHLVNRPLSRNKRVTESNSVGVRRRKKYGSILTGKR